MTPLRQRMLEDMQLRNLTPETQKNYIHHVAGFARYFGQSPEVLDLEAVRQYQLYLLNQRKLSPETINQYISSVKFLYLTNASATTVFWPTAIARLQARTLPPAAGHALLRSASHPQRLPRLLAGTHRQVPAALSPMRHRKPGLPAGSAALSPSAGAPHGQLMRPGSPNPKPPQRCLPDSTHPRSVPRPSQTASLGVDRTAAVLNRRFHSSPRVTPSCRLSRHRSKNPIPVRSPHRRRKPRPRAKPIQEPASRCGLVHCTVSSACGPAPSLFPWPPQAAS